MTSAGGVLPELVKALHDVQVRRPHEAGAIPSATVAAGGAAARVDGCHTTQNYTK